MEPFQIFPEVDSRVVKRRRLMVFATITLLSGLATWFMADLLWTVPGITLVKLALLVLFALLFAHITFGFVVAVMGYRVMRAGEKCVKITDTAEGYEIGDEVATAVVMPIFNEDVSRVFEGLRVIYRSLEETGHLTSYDFFILSDSNRPNQWVQEEVAWLELCKQVGGFGRIFYRKRRQQINKKSGNVADFLRRWGARYRYMIVLDADSIMTGEAMVRLTTMMEAHPRVGLIQTAPRLVYGKTFYARMQQFANRLYGPMFLAGINHWQQHEGNYWGHNAIIRVQPFIEHCALPDLPGREPFGGRILSHDFVEAALMRKAGYAVWMAHDIEGTYEEGPPTLIDSAKRDRRWCQGNMQHSWLIFARGLHSMHRIHLTLGVMGYASSLLWLTFILLGVLSGLDSALWQSGTWIFREHAAVAGPLLALTLFLLFLPKWLSGLLAGGNPERVVLFGGRGRMWAGIVLETLTSSLIAPIHMLFNSKFVVFTLLGRGVSWVAQRRAKDPDGVDWREAVLTHAGHTFLGLVWLALAWSLLPGAVWWMLPVIAGLIGSIPLSLLLSSESVGGWLREKRLLVVPDELSPTYELKRLEQNLAECHRHLPPPESLRADYGLMQAVLDPYINALHVSLLRQRKRASEESREWMAQLCQRLLSQGPSSLTDREKTMVLNDPESLIKLHENLWQCAASGLSPWWSLAMRQYNILTQEPETALYR